MKTSCSNKVKFITEDEIQKVNVILNGKVSNVMKLVQKKRGHRF